MNYKILIYQDITPPDLEPRRMAIHQYSEPEGKTRLSLFAYLSSGPDEALSGERVWSDICPAGTSDLEILGRAYQLLLKFICKVYVTAPADLQDHRDDDAENIYNL